MAYLFPSKEALPRIAELPDPFRKPDGNRVASPAEWPAQRAYIKAMLSHYLYGTAPDAPGDVAGEVLFSRPVYSGRAVAEAVRITCAGGALRFDCDVIRPVREGRVPVIVANRFPGQPVCPDEENVVLDHGYAVASFVQSDAVPDNALAIQSPLATAYPDYGWGAIAMWGWAHSRVADYLATTDYADMDKLAVTGHSRGGKAALYAAVYDERFAVCIAAGSGCGGLGCFRFLGGRLGLGTGVCETAGSIVDFFPHWWQDAFGSFGLRAEAHTRNTAELVTDYKPRMLAWRKAGTAGKLGDEALLPFDLHFLRAAIAPRAVLSIDGLGDTWANPYGTQITWQAAEEVYRFLDAPARNALLMRDGPHEYQKQDWAAAVEFCDQVLFGAAPPVNIQQSLPAQAPRSMIEQPQQKMHFSWRAPGC